MIDAVKYPIVLTEKATSQLENYKYSFQVDVKLSKNQIKTLIQNHYNVKVVRINTHRPPRKKGQIAYKRAILTLDKALSFFEV